MTETLLTQHKQTTADNKYLFFFGGGGGGVIKAWNFIWVDDSREIPSLNWFWKEGQNFEMLSASDF